VIEARLENGQRIVQRRFRVGAARQPFWLILGRTPSDEVARLNVSLSVTAGRAVELLVNQRTTTQ